MFLIIISILSYDIWFYISHLLLHTRRGYKYHSEHHQYMHPTFLDTHKGHIVETVGQSIGFLFPLIIYTYTLQDVCIAAAFVSVRGLMRHDDRCIFLIGNHHLLHHRYPSYNFGEYWIDYVCGTLYPNEKEQIAGILYH